MNKSIKAILLLFIFLFHIGLGAACAMGMIGGSAATDEEGHYNVCHHLKSLEVLVVHKEKSTYTMQQGADCCKDVVYKFDKLDKQVKGEINWDFTAKESLLLHIIYFAYQQLFNPTVERDFIKDRVAWSPPLQVDIRLSINSFQI